MPAVSFDILQNHSTCLIAVSGGSDSLALLHLLSEQPTSKLHVATVDHGLRPEAANEASYVAQVCADLGIPHQTLNWVPNATDAQSARIGRYALLADYARKIGATAIALGHTQDDQAETLVMRAARMNSDSGTRGLSGMTSVSAYGSLRLLRPLLGCSRQSLRDYLKHKSVRWIDDPSNEKLSSERVRTRQLLATSNTLPDAQKIAQLACLTCRSRAWLNNHVAAAIRNHVVLNNCELTFCHTPNLPNAIVHEIMTTLIWITGGMPYRPAPHKIDDLVTALQNGNSTRKAVGRTLVEIKRGTVTLQRERRNLPPFPKSDARPIPYDNRLRVLPNGAVKTFITAIENFRPSCDDAVYKALMHTLDSLCHGTARLT